ncbi:hypothetical protein SMA5143A_3028 [Streptomyces sp. MA5143a]|nr:hypothetical protein SMA5143A_3028 [Streptomyces sp. MA5143a]
MNTAAATPRAGPEDASAAPVHRRFAMATGCRFTTARDRPLAARFGAAVHHGPASPVRRGSGRRSLRFRPAGHYGFGPPVTTVSGRPGHYSWDRPVRRAVRVPSVHHGHGEPVHHSSGRPFAARFGCRRFTTATGNRFTTPPAGRSPRGSGAVGSPRSRAAASPPLRPAVRRVVPARWATTATGSCLTTAPACRSRRVVPARRATTALGRPFATVADRRPAGPSRLGPSGSPPPRSAHFATASGRAASGSVGGRPVPGRPGFPRPPARSRG